MEFVSHLGKKLLLPGLLFGMLYYLKMQDPQKKCLLNLPKEDKTILHGSCFMKESAIHSPEHRRKQPMNFVSTRQNRSSNLVLHGKICQILWICRLKMDVPMIQKNFGLLSRQQDVSVNYRTLEVAHNTLPVYLGNNISFWGL